MTVSFSARRRSPLLTSLNYQGFYDIANSNDISCDIEVISGSPIGEDVIYSLPQLPSALHTRRISYKVRVPYILPEMSEVYYKGIFNNSIAINLHRFDKFDFMYLPFKLGEHFNNAEFNHYDDVVMNFKWHPVVRPNYNSPSEICGELFLLPQKYPDEKQLKKQQHMCFRSCIFK